MSDELTRSTDEQLRIGFIVDTLHVSKYVADLVQWTIHQNNMRVVSLVIQRPHRESESSKISVGRSRVSLSKYYLTVRSMFWRILTRIENIRLKSIRLHSDHLSRFELDNSLDNLVVFPLMSESGLVYRYSDSDIEKLRSCNFDVLMRCGSGILKGDVLNVARFGIISFHHADNRVNRGGPAGFWEVFNREPKTGFVIQRLTEELDGGQVLVRGSFPTLSYYLLNQASLCSRSNYYMKKLLSDMARERKLPIPEPNWPYSNELFRLPRLDVQLSYLIRVIWSAINAKVRFHIFKHRQRWSVAYQRTAWRDLVMWRSTRIVNPSGRFLADPFVICRDGAHYCFVEDYDYSTDRGCISVVCLADPTHRVERVIVEPFHLSFPYLFEFDGKLYMLPESHENRDIRVYECLEFPLRWSLKAVLMKDLSAADSMVFFKAGYWWLLTNIAVQAGADHSSELFIYYSDCPISTRWTPHPKNPIYVDPSIARNGGLLVDGNDVYRVGQRQNFSQYGAEASIYRIETLDIQNYVEHEVAKIKPNFFNALGVHHIHSSEGCTVFDFVRSERTKK